MVLGPFAETKRPVLSSVEGTSLPVDTGIYFILLKPSRDRKGLGVIVDDLRCQSG